MHSAPHERMGAVVRRLRLARGAPLELVAVPLMVLVDQLLRRFFCFGAIDRPAHHRPDRHPAHGRAAPWQRRVAHCCALHCCVAYLLRVAALHMRASYAHCCIVASSRCRMLQTACCAVHGAGPDAPMSCCTLQRMLLPAVHGGVACCAHCTSHAGAMLRVAECQRKRRRPSASVLGCNEGTVGVLGTHGAISTASRY